MPKRKAKKVVLGRNGQPISKSAAKLRLLKTLKCTTRFEKLAAAAGASLIAGVDEVGRGSLFGPVVAAAVILNPSDRIRGLRDSKLVPAGRREVLAARIRQRAVAWAIAAVDAAQIDQLNIYHATRLAMLLAVSKLQPAPDHLLVDALTVDWPSAQARCPQSRIIHGDALSASVAAASIIAKVERDRLVSEWDPVFPVFRLASNKGYYTRAHARSLREHGPSPLHRQSFAPVWMAAAPEEALSAMLEQTVAAARGGQ